VVPSSSASIGPVTVSTLALISTTAAASPPDDTSLTRHLRSSPYTPAGPYPTRVPRSWAIAMTILVLCLLASIVIALVRLL
jgi:hypothetical protein